MSLEKDVINGAIISQTLDALNNSPYSGGDDTDSSPIENASVVTKTLDYMNSRKQKGSQQAISASYDFNKDVLSAVYSGKGGITNLGT